MISGYLNLDSLSLHFRKLSLYRVIIPLNIRSVYVEKWHQDERKNEKDLREPSKKGKKMIENLGDKTLSNRPNINDQKENLEDITTLSNVPNTNSQEFIETYNPNEFEYDNSLNEKHIFNEEVLTRLRNFLQLTCYTEPYEETDINREKRALIYKSPHLTEKMYKKTTCKFCESLVVSRHFSRHLERHHSDEREVKELSEYKPGSRIRKHLLELLRNEGNLENVIRGKIIPKKKENQRKVRSMKRIMQFVLSV
nr:unnamed protein product [Callosobruchus analis]